MDNRQFGRSDIVCLAVSQLNNNFEVIQVMHDFAITSLYVVHGVPDLCSTGHDLLLQRIVDSQ